ncbi:MAG TPA: hypothetical protein VM680_05885 [Verrucomicrobiae bacterium]|nr:hypothetical protein [Verrucomicrobiae bacterium]
MNRLRDLIGIVAICATAALFTGCGGDDDDNAAPAQLAPDSLAGKTYNLTDAGEGGSIVFANEGNGYTLTRGAGAAETGTFAAERQGDVWNVTTTDTTATTTSQLVLTFNSANGGTYTFTAPGQEPVNGSFVDANPGTTTSGTTTTGETTGTTNGSTTGTTSGTTTGSVPAPATLSQATFTTGAGGGIGEGTIYTVNFTGGTQGTFTAVNPQGDSMGSGNFTYTPNGNQAHLVLNYSQNNDSDDVTLNFNAAPGGTGNTYTGTQVVSGTTYPANGTFTY